jgi:hypothetical protein
VRRPQKWEPTEEQFAAYLNREREHAKKNVATGLQSIGFSSVQDLLHSREITHEAMQAILSQKPNRFSCDPRRFSSLPRERKGVAA